MIMDLEPEEHYAMQREVDRALSERQHEEQLQAFMARAEHDRQQAAEMQEQMSQRDAEMKEETGRRHREHMEALNLIARQMSRVADALGASSQGRLEQ
jgi:hypothetical protein